MGRRGPEDDEWQELKVRVKDRDRNQDRLIRILTVREVALLKRSAPPFLLIQLDPAHIYPVSTHPKLVYDDDNVVLLNRWSHTNLDCMKCPLTGKPISCEERQKWWERIAAPEQWERLLLKL